MNNPSISVLVPSYNHAPFVERCLKSIINQTLIPSELLVIDDGSQDGSPKIIERVLQDCTFPCELVARENRGLCATLNEGLARTSGEFFAYLGSDDVWFPQFLAARAKLLELRQNAVLAYGHALVINEEDRVIDCSVHWANADYPHGDARPMLLQGTSLMSPTVVYRRSKLSQRRWNEDAKLEDYELYLQLVDDGDFAFDPQVLSAWRIHSYNTSRDPRWLLSEVLEAQGRVAAALKWDQARLRRMQRATRFQFAEDFARKGYKAAALSLLLKNFWGAPSLRRIADVALRLALPQRVLSMRRRSMQEKVAEHYGVLQF